MSTTPAPVCDCAAAAARAERRAELAGLAAQLAQRADEHDRITRAAGDGPAGAAFARGIRHAAGHVRRTANT